MYTEMETQWEGDTRSLIKLDYADACESRVVKQRLESQHKVERERELWMNLPVAGGQLDSNPVNPFKPNNAVIETRSKR